LYVWKQLTPSTPQQLAFGLACGMTDTGLVRRSNEDNFLIDPALGLVAIADGMGGHDGGEVASADALQALAHFLTARLEAGKATAGADGSEVANLNDTDWNDAITSALLDAHHAVEYANTSIYRTNLANRRGDGAGMGTTLTGIWQPDPNNTAFIFHVGDTRLYRLREGQLLQLTRDQTMYQLAVETGEVDNLPGRNLLLQALGPSPDVAPELHATTIAPGDRYLLCSDGLHGATGDADVGAILAATGTDNIEASCASLIEMAKRDGSRDNITVVIVCYPS
jgi:serine/threonine protein phosphatase PrpC